MSDESYLIRLTPAQRDILFALVNRAPLDGFAFGDLELLIQVMFALNNPFVPQTDDVLIEEIADGDV